MHFFPFNNTRRLSGLNIHKLLSTFTFQNENPPFIIYLKPYLMRIFLTTVPLIVVVIKRKREKEFQRCVIFSRQVRVFKELTPPLSAEPPFRETSGRGLGSRAVLLKGAASARVSEWVREWERESKKGGLNMDTSLGDSCKLVLTPKWRPTSS